MVGVVEIAEGMPAGMGLDAVGICLPGVDYSVKVAVLGEIEVYHA